MTRLLRPHIPLETRCRVVLRQLGEMWPDKVIAAHGKRLKQLLTLKLGHLAALMASAVSDLHLDHDPPLGARVKVTRKGKHIGYLPDANDPEHLIYRDKHAHRIKTNVRGEHGQHPDRVLIKKERRRTRPKKAKPRRREWPKRKVASAKRPWPKRKIRR